MTPMVRTSLVVAECGYSQGPRKNASEDTFHPGARAGQATVPTG